MHLSLDQPLPPPARSTRVILGLWGCTDADIKRAEADARHWDFSRKWEIVEVIPSTGIPCPIPPHDPTALHQHTMYDAAWAAYRVGQVPPWVATDPRSASP